MKQIFNFVLTLLTIAMLGLMTFAKINATTNWVDLSSYTKVIEIITNYGPIVLVCCFAFGSLFGKVLSKFLFVIILLLLIVFSIAMFAPQLITKIFGA